MRWGAPSPRSATTEAADAAPLAPAAIEEIRRSRRHPVPIQKDYLHLRVLLHDLAAAIATVPGPVRDVLDVYCGTKPYRDLLAPDVRYVGLDVDRRYGEPDVVSTEFLPFEDASFDLVLCIEGFHYVADAERAVRELWRVVRPGGSVILTVPLMWEYDRTTHESRYTGHDLAALFDGWQDVEVVENGGRGVTWATITADTVDLLEHGLARRMPAVRALSPLFAAAYLTINALGAQIERAERRFGRSTFALPMNLLVRARRPA